jgi:hypothetical protein
MNIIGVPSIDFYIEFKTIGMDGQEFLMDKQITIRVG